LAYAKRIKANPQSSVSYKSDEFFRKDFSSTDDHNAKFGLGHKLVILTLIAGMTWVAIGAIMQEYFIPEIATVFFITGFVAGVIGVIFKLNNMDVNDIAKSFIAGCRDLLGAALVVGMAKGIIIILSLGGDLNPENPTILNTILYSAGSAE
jgi:uncharacterized ion transporter superfamily protein YfcC